MRRFSRAAYAFALVAAAAAFAGCGEEDDEASAEQAVRDYYEAFVEGDADGICDQLSAESQRHVPGGLECEDFFEAVFDDSESKAVVKAVRSAKITVRLRGSSGSASAEFPSGLEGDVVSLVKEDGGWKVEETFDGFVETPSRVPGVSEGKQLSRSQYQAAIQEVLRDSLRWSGVASELGYGEPRPRQECIAMFQLVRSLAKRTIKQVKALRPPPDAAALQAAIVRAGRAALAFAGRMRQRVAAGEIACGQHLARLLYHGWKKSKVDQRIADLEKRGYVVFGE